MKKFLLVLVVLMFAGCAVAPTATTPEQNLVTACNAYANGLTVLAGYRKAGKLSAAQIAEVDKIRAVVNPICTGSNPPTDVNGAINTVENYALQLNGIQTGVK